MVHAVSVSKSHRQNFFSRKKTKNLFRDNIGYKQRFSPPVAKRRQFSDFWLEFLNEAEKEKNDGKGDSASAPSRLASLFEGEMQQILTERHW